MKSTITRGIALGVGICASGLASATVHIGTPLGDHLNGTVQNRGACTILSPVTVSGSPWFCNHLPGNSLYHQINSLLEQAAVNGKKCRISTTALDFYGHHKIDWIDCPPIP